MNRFGLLHDCSLGSVLLNVVMSDMTLDVATVQNSSVAFGEDSMVLQIQT